MNYFQSLDVQGVNIFIRHHFESPKQTRKLEKLVETYSSSYKQFSVRRRDEKICNETALS